MTGYQPIHWMTRLTNKLEKTFYSGYSKNKFQYLIRTYYWNLHSSTWDDYPALLDLGCATGSYSFVLAKKHINVTGLDYAIKMMRKVEKKGQDSNIKNVSFLNADIISD
jgi:2-polyprenyl-3-methyl-5-hydroxy-6-metoxy-1,4-benzoquinol methylase